MDYGYGYDFEDDDALLAELGASGVARSSRGPSYGRPLAWGDEHAASALPLPVPLPRAAPSPFPSAFSSAFSSAFADTYSDSYTEAYSEARLRGIGAGITRSGMRERARG